MRWISSRREYLKAAFYLLVCILEKKRDRSIPCTKYNVSIPSLFCQEEKMDGEEIAVGGEARLTCMSARDRKVFKSYEVRNADLSRLGYVSYTAYLLSDDWAVIRDRKIKKHPICLLCPTKASNVHHLSYRYEVLMGRSDHLLVCLCRDCHETIEFDGTKKRTLEEANDELIAKARAKGLINWIKAVKSGLRWLKHNRPPDSLMPTKKLCIGCQKNIPKHGKTLCKFCKRDRSLE